MPLAPGIRLGYVVASPDLVARMAMIRQTIDRQGDGPLEVAVASMIDDGELVRHARKWPRAMGEDHRRYGRRALEHGRCAGRLSVLFSRNFCALSYRVSPIS